MSREPPEPLECYNCHHRVGPWLYFRFVGDRYNFKCKCINCMTYDDLIWKDKMVYDWRKEHPEFNHKPINAEDRREYVDMCLRYIKKIARSATAPLPYSAKQRQAEPEIPEEQALRELENIKIPER